jgi:hypothetical protein
MTPHGALPSLTHLMPYLYLSELPLRMYCTLVLAHTTSIHPQSTQEIIFSKTTLFTYGLLQKTHLDQGSPNTLWPYVPSCLSLNPSSSKLSLS